MPKVLRILNRFIIGGPALHVVNLSTFMGAEFETRLIVGHKDNEEKGAEFLFNDRVVSVTYIEEMSRRLNFIDDFRAYQKIRKIIKEFKPDIVDTHGSKAGALGRMAAYSLKVPVIIHTYHGHIFHSYFGVIKTRLYIMIERYLARKSDAIIAISNQQKEELAEDFKIAPAWKIHVLPLCLDLTRFRENYNDKRKLFREEFCLSNNDIAIGIIGRLVPIKNHPLFLNAFSNALKHSAKKIKAFIVGDGAVKGDLELLAKELGLSFTSEQNVDFTKFDLVFTSWRSDIDVVNAGLDIVVLSSFNEGTPVSLIDAQASDKPIVATNAGGIKDIVLDNETGLLSGVNMPQLFIDNLLRVIEDDDLRKRLSEKSNHHILIKYNRDVSVSMTTQLYESLLKKKQA